MIPNSVSSQIHVSSPFHDPDGKWSHGQIQSSDTPWHRAPSHAGMTVHLLCSLLEQLHLDNWLGECLPKIKIYAINCFLRRCCARKWDVLFLMSECWPLLTSRYPVLLTSNMIILFMIIFFSMIKIMLSCSSFSSLFPSSSRQGEQFPFPGSCDHTFIHDSSSENCWDFELLQLRRCKHPSCLIMSWPISGRALALLSLLLTTCLTSLISLIK